MARPKIALFVLIGLVAAGCPNNGSNSTTGGASSGSTTSNSGNGGLGNVRPGSATSSSGASGVLSNGHVVVSASPQCSVFQNNPHDYATCQGCAQTLCTCSRPDPTNANVCLIDNVAGCTLDLNQLIQCVHANTTTTGGTCVGLTCSAGQVADFSACLCRDSQPPTSIGPAPGQGDTSTPYLEPGFVVSDRYCPPSTLPINQPAAGASGLVMQDDCLLDGPQLASGPSTAPGYDTPANANGISDPGVPPQYQNQSPANVYADVGYLRWDLGLDASQFGAATTLQASRPFLGSWATFPLSLNMFYQLKPNTVLKNLNTVPNGTPIVSLTDCVEHYSGYFISGGGSGVSGAAPMTDCENTTAGQISGIPISQSSGLLTGAASQQYISANGNSANPNILTFATSSNPAMITGRGLANTLANKTGLFSNVSYYKYTWGPVIVTAPPSAAKTGVPAQLGSGTVSGHIAVNLNLGFTPAATVESSAMSGAAVTSSVPSRDCTVNSTPYSCVVSSVYRAPGGGVLSQSFSSQFAGNHNASTVMALSSGVAAVSTPALVEDTSQLDVSDAHVHLPAKLRAFVRADDGNIYMSRFETGSWNPWLSLGRPWICNPNGTGTGSCTSTPANLPPVYRPLQFNTNNLGYKGGTNDGISIAGAPVVASYMTNNAVYANLGGPDNGAPLQILGVNIYSGGGHTFLSFAFATDPTLAQPLITNGQSVFIDGIQMSGASQVNPNTAYTVTRVTNSGGVACPVTLSFTGVEKCQIDVDLLTGGSWAINGGSGYTNSLKITQSVASTTFNTGIIAVFVRVSQLNSTDGTAGPLHNSVWYTLSVSKGDQIVQGKPWDFDTPANWTQWQAVTDDPTGAGDIFRTQGNPTVFIDTPPGGKIALHVIGTQMNSGQLHPPLAPTYATPTKDDIQNNGATAGAIILHNYFNRNVSMANNPTPGWYGYGTKFIWADMDLTSLGKTAPWAQSNQPNQIASPAGGPLTWTNFGFNFIDTSQAKRVSMQHKLVAGVSTSYLPQNPYSAGAVTGADYVGDIPAATAIVSDWTYAPTTTSTYRFMAVGLNNVEDPCFELEPTDKNGAATPPPTFPTLGDPSHPTSQLLITPCKYTKNMVWIELKAAAGPNQYNLISAGCTSAANYFYADPSGATVDGAPVNVNGGPGGRLSMGAPIMPWALPGNDSTTATPKFNVGHGNGDLIAPFIMGMVGTPHAVNVTTQSGLPNAWWSGDPMQGHGMLVFTRAVCPDKGRCDPVNPVVSYLAVPEYSLCTGAKQPVQVPASGAGTNLFESTMYFGGESFSTCTQACNPPKNPRINKAAVGTDPVTACSCNIGDDTRKTQTTVFQFPATADVVPIVSHEQLFHNSDVPVYLLTRDSNGNIAHGFWSGTTDTTGAQGGTHAFTMFSSGAFSN